MENKKIAFVGICFLLCFSIASVNANAFTFFGIDWGKFFEKISFWKNDEVKETPKVKEEIKKTTSDKEDENYLKNKYIEKKPVEKSNKTTVKKAPVVKKEVSVDLAGINYRETDFKLMLAEQKDYIQGFNYECIYIETDKGSKFTLNFNTETGEFKSLKLGDSCERKIYVEEEVITELQTNGFKASKIKTYLEKVDLPTTMYFKAIKVFTVG